MKPPRLCSGRVRGSFVISAVPRNRSASGASLRCWHVPGGTCQSAVIAARWGRSLSSASPWQHLISWRLRYLSYMGRLIYGSAAEPVLIEDRALAHLKVVVATKLRRQESFTLSWKHPDGEAAGRSTIWVHPSIPLRFVFDEAEAPQLNVRWIEALMHSASSTGGIALVDEVIESEEN